MLKIGDAVKHFNLSHRTLRYWEEVKILDSKRAENGYRYYDELNAARIEQIVFLRQLKVSIADIGLIISGNANTAIDVLTCHLKKVQQETADLTELYKVLESIISEIKSKGSFTVLPQKLLSENERSIKLHTVKAEPDRFVRLPKMVMACYRAESETPECDCYAVIKEFIAKNSLHEQYGFRHFGFNNPNPSEDTPIYGYEMWVSIPEDVEVTEPLWKMEFPGGLYAGITTNLAEIGERSMKLYGWVNNNGKHEHDTSRPWLEEFTDYKTFWEDGSLADSERQLDLLAPVIS